MRTATVNRKTNETDIKLTLTLDGSLSGSKIITGIGFFDHMLTALSVHSGIAMNLSSIGDLQVDCHHTVEDVGIVLGQAFALALGEKRGIARFGSAHIPMDEALGFATIDISNRPFLVFNGEFFKAKIGEFDTCMVKEFFRAFAFNAGITLHIAIPYGENDHHKCEAAFKAVAHALRAAIALEGEKTLSTKGVL